MQRLLVFLVVALVGLCPACGQTPAQNTSPANAASSAQPPAAKPELPALTPPQAGTGQAQPMQQQAVAPPSEETQAPSIYSIWRQTQDSEVGFLGISPKTEEIIAICKKGTLEGYAGWVLMLHRDIIVTENKIAFTGYKLTLPYELSNDNLTMKTGDGKVMKYERLVGSARTSFIATVVEKGVGGVCR
jgi:hypothetical protein